MLIPSMCPILLPKTTGFHSAIYSFLNTNTMGTFVSPTSLSAVPLAGASAVAVVEAVEAQQAQRGHERPPRRAAPLASAGRARRLLLEVVLRLVGQLLPELPLHVQQLLRQLAVRGARVLDAEALEVVVLNAVLDVGDVEVPVVVGVDVDALDQAGVHLVVDHDLLLQVLLRLPRGGGVVVPPSPSLVLAAPRDPSQLATHVLGRPRLRDVRVVVVHLLQLLRRARKKT